MKNSTELIIDLVEPTVTAMELELWGIELLPQGRSSLLRIYIESELGIDIEDCEKVSRQVSSILDVEDPISGEYTLEVSSPGTDRPLFTVEQFARYVASEVSLRMRTAIDGRRKFKGIITKVEEGNIGLQVDDQEYVLPHANVEKANIVFQY